MQVIKRDGQKQRIDPNKVIWRLRNLCALEEDMKTLAEKNPTMYRINKTFQPLANVDYEKIALETLRGLKDGVTTSELDDLAAFIAQPMSFDHPEYGVLAARIVISNYHKNTTMNLQHHFASQSGGPLAIDDIEKNTLRYTTEALYQNVDVNGDRSPLVTPLYKAIMQKYGDTLESWIDYNRDYNYDFIGFDVLKKSYLMSCSLRDAQGNLLRDAQRKIVRTPVERPQHMIMRVAVGIHCAGKYRDYNLMRYGKSIYETFCNLVENNPRFNKLYESVKNQHMRGELIDWKEVSAILPFKQRKILRAAMTDVISWDALAQWCATNDPLATVSDALLRDIRRTYDAMSQMYMTHATPTLFNAGTLKPQLSSCYLIALGDDSMKYITKLWADASEISKWSGGIGSWSYNLRPKGSYIRGTNGNSDGSVPYMRVVDGVAVYVNQGGKRDGVHATYWTMWCADIFRILDLRKPRGNEMERARHLFYAMWIQDEYMRCLQEEIRQEEELRKAGDTDTKPMLWYLINPDECPEICEHFDQELVTTWLPDDQVDPVKHAFTYYYRKCVREGKYVKRVSAQDLWRAVCETIEETGVPYILFADAANRKSNQQNLGTIKSSNLCTEIIEYSDARETAVCNLASIALSRFVTDQKPVDADRYAFSEGFVTAISKSTDAKRKWFDFTKLGEIAALATYNLNRVIDCNYYPIPETETSNMLHRPIGIGVQDLANLYTMLRLPFDSAEAQKLNFYIFEMLSYATLTESHRLATIEGAYQTFNDSPLAQGKFQHDLWIEEQKPLGRDALLHPLKLDWNTLRTNITTKGGVRNSLLLAPMPTGTTSTIMGNSPCFEPHNALVYKRPNKTGEHTVVNKYLLRDLMELGLWNNQVRNAIMMDSRGGIADVVQIPKEIRDIYKTVWDMSPKAIINQGLARGVFVCQSQSMSLFIPRPTPKLLTQIHFYSWVRGIKTSSYYTRRLAAVDAQKIQVVEQPAIRDAIVNSDDQVCYIRSDGTRACCDA